MVFFPFLILFSSTTSFSSQFPFPKNLFHPIPLSVTKLREKLCNKINISFVSYFHMKLTYKHDVKVCLWEIIVWDEFGLYALSWIKWTKLFWKVVQLNKLQSYVGKNSNNSTGRFVFEIITVDVITASEMVVDIFFVVTGLMVCSLLVLARLDCLFIYFFTINWNYWELTTYYHVFFLLTDFDTHIRWTWIAFVHIKMYDVRCVDMKDESVKKQPCKFTMKLFLMTEDMICNLRTSYAQQTSVMTKIKMVPFEFVTSLKAWYLKLNLPHIDWVEKLGLHLALMVV